MDLAEREHAGAWRAFEVFATALPQGRMIHRPGVAAAVTGSPNPLFNQAMVRDGGAGPDELAEVLDELASTGLRHTVVLRQAVDDRFTELLGRRGFTSRVSTPGMALHPIPTAVPDSTLDIRSGPGLFDEHRRLTAIGFEMAPEDVDSFMHSSVAHLDGVDLYVGYEDGEAVATALGFAREGTLTVFNVVTVPEHRGKGHGGAITMAAVAGGASRGCDVAALQSTPSGLPVYVRLGFETVVEYDIWVSPSAPQA
jgi:GNAT superfamily N-acetyltransferase